MPRLVFAAPTPAHLPRDRAPTQGTRQARYPRAEGADRESCCDRNCRGREARRPRPSFFDAQSSYARAPIRKLVFRTIPVLSYTDERFIGRYVSAVDRLIGDLYVLELNI